MASCLSLAEPHFGQASGFGECADGLRYGNVLFLVRIGGNDERKVKKVG